MAADATKPMTINNLSKKLCKSQSMAINKWLPTNYPKTSSTNKSLDARLMRKVMDTTFNRRALQLFSLIAFATRCGSNNEQSQVKRLPLF
jgi:hypothetical protein